MSNVLTQHQGLTITLELMDTPGEMPIPAQPSKPIGVYTSYYPMIGGKEALKSLVREIRGFLLERFNARAKAAHKFPVV